MIMNNTFEVPRVEQEKIEAVASDLLRTVRINKAFIIWITFLFAMLAVCLYFYITQLRTGLGVTGLTDVTSWGMYIANFVFFVACSLVGMLISAVLGLTGFKWITPLARIAEIIAVGFAAVAGLVIISDMGRPDRLPYVFMYGRVQSPILWDVTVVTTYFVISLLLWFFPLIPDIAVARSRLEGRPKFLVRTYEILSFKWLHHDEQYLMLNKAVRILLLLSYPPPLQYIRLHRGCLPLPQGQDGTVRYSGPILYRGHLWRAPQPCL